MNKEADVGEIRSKPINQDGCEVYVRDSIKRRRG